MFCSAASVLSACLQRGHVLQLHSVTKLFRYFTKHDAMCGCAQGRTTDRVAGCRAWDLEGWIIGAKKWILTVLRRGIQDPALHSTCPHISTLSFWDLHFIPDGWRKNR